MLTLQLVQLVRPWVDLFLPDLPDMVLSVHIFSFLTETNLVDYVTVVMIQFGCVKEKNLYHCKSKFMDVASIVAFRYLFEADF